MAPKNLVIVVMAPCEARTALAEPTHAVTNEAAEAMETLVSTPMPVISSRCPIRCKRKPRDCAEYRVPHHFILGLQSPGSSSRSHSLPAAQIPCRHHADMSNHSPFAASPNDLSMSGPPWLKCSCTVQQLWPHDIPCL